MNWVGGARNRIKLKNEKKIQKEFFERKRHEKKVSKWKSSPESKKRSGLSQDLLFFHTVIRTHDDSNGSKYQSKVKRKPIHVDLDKLNPSQNSKNVDLGPISPIVTDQRSDNPDPSSNGNASSSKRNFRTEEQDTNIEHPLPRHLQNIQTDAANAGRSKLHGVTPSNSTQLSTSFKNELAAQRYEDSFIVARKQGLTCRPQWATTSQIFSSTPYVVNNIPQLPMKTPVTYSLKKSSKLKSGDRRLKNFPEEEKLQIANGNIPKKVNDLNRLELHAKVHKDVVSASGSGNIKFLADRNVVPENSNVNAYLHKPEVEEPTDNFCSKQSSKEPIQETIQNSNRFENLVTDTDIKEQIFRNKFSAPVYAPNSKRKTPSVHFISTLSGDTLNVKPQSDPLESQQKNAECGNSRSGGSPLLLFCESFTPYSRNPKLYSQACESKETSSTNFTNTSLTFNSFKSRNHDSKRETNAVVLDKHNCSDGCLNELRHTNDEGHFNSTENTKITEATSKCIQDGGEDHAEHHKNKDADEIGKTDELNTSTGLSQSVHDAVVHLMDLDDDLSEKSSTHSNWSASPMEGNNYGHKNLSVDSCSKDNQDINVENSQPMPVAESKGWEGIMPQNSIISYVINGNLSGLSTRIHIPAQMDTKDSSTQTVHNKYCDSAIMCRLLMPQNTPSKDDNGSKLLSDESTGNFLVCHENLSFSPHIDARSSNAPEMCDEDITCSENVSLEHRFHTKEESRSSVCNPENNHNDVSKP